MPSVLISTSSLWNCGDDFIRDGVLRLLDLKDEVSTIWWNRGFGIEAKFANSLRVNLPKTDYFLVAGTPQWLMLNEEIYEYCISNRIPISLVGVGTRGYSSTRHKRILQRVGESGLCELAYARDSMAYAALKEFGIDHASMIVDPAVFKRPITNRKDISVIGWRDYRIPLYDPRLVLTDPLRWIIVKARDMRDMRPFHAAIDEYDQRMVATFNNTKGEKIIVLHDNREIERAEQLFGKNAIYYSSDYEKIFSMYSRTKVYIGSRLHGAIPALLHGAATNLVYLDDRWHAFSHVCTELAKICPGLLDSISCTVIRRDAWPAEFRSSGAGFDCVQEAIEVVIRQSRAKIKSSKTRMANFIK